MGNCDLIWPLDQTSSMAICIWSSMCNLCREFSHQRMLHPKLIVLPCTFTIPANPVECGFRMNTKLSRILAFAPHPTVKMQKHCHVLANQLATRVTWTVLIMLDSK